MTDGIETHESVITAALIDDDLDHPTIEAPDRLVVNQR